MTDDALIIERIARAYYARRCGGAFPLYGEQTSGGRLALTEAANVKPSNAAAVCLAAAQIVYSEALVGSMIDTLKIWRDELLTTRPHTEGDARAVKLAHVQDLLLRATRLPEPL